MINYLQIENLSKSFGDRYLFSNISFSIGEGEKVGLIAKNGTGKTTLMNILAGIEPYDEGKITYKNDLKVGYLSQTNNFDPESSIIDTCLHADDDVSKVIKRYEKALYNNEDISSLLSEMDALNAWDYENRFKQILSQLNIIDSNQLIKHLSGGQLKKVAIAKVLIDNPDLLFLDEPTNHLDIEMIEWLENYLSRNKITLLMVTHDRYFLDKVCNKIIEIDNNQIFSYIGNYNYYLEKRAERIENMNAETAKASNLLRKELDWMRRQPQARATKAKYRIDAFYDLQKKASVNYREDNLKLDFKSSYIGKKIFEANNVDKKFGDKIILKDFNYIFARYEKLGIVGNNGVGKSTFIKLLLGIVKPDNGFFDIGETVKFGYYSQEGQIVDESKKVIDVIKEIAEVIHIDDKRSYTASQFLQHFLFSPSDQQKFVYKLSGGEKRRLYLASILTRKPNFLILDEPTNDLDIVTLEVLEDYIEHFDGCVIIISHDRFFMDRSVDHIFAFEGNGVIKDFPGNYSEYRDWKTQVEQEANNSNKKETKKTSHKENKHSTNKLSFKEKLEFENISKEIEELEKEKKEIESILNGSQTDNTDFNEIAIRYSTVKDLLDEKEMRWLELSEKE